MRQLITNPFRLEWNRSNYILIVLRIIFLFSRLTVHQCFSDKPHQCTATKYQSNISRLQRASNMASRELSASLLCRGPTMYPAALKWRSIVADVAGTDRVMPGA